MCGSELMKNAAPVKALAQMLRRALLLPGALLAAGLASGCVGTAQSPVGLTAAPSAVVDQNPDATIVAGIVPDRAPPVAIGDNIGLKLSASADAYGHLYLMNASGRVFVLVENLRLPANVQVRYPEDNAGQTLRAQPPAGVERVVLLVTRHRFAGFSQGAAASGPVQIAVGAREFVSDLNAATRQLPKEDWTIMETRLQIIG